MIKLVLYLFFSSDIQLRQTICKNQKILNTNILQVQSYKFKGLTKLIDIILLLNKKLLFI